MGVEINSGIIWKPHDWVVTEAIPNDTQQCFAKVELNEQEVIGDKLNWYPFTPDHIEDGTTRLSKSYWYPLVGLEDGVYFAKSVMRPRDEIKLWLRVENETIVSQSLRSAQALSWFGETSETISFQCGHKYTVTLHGSPARVRQAREQMASQDCTDCYRTARYLIALKTAQKLNLPPLQGSNRQIEWAEQIRATALQDLMAWEVYWDEFLAKLQEIGITDEDAYCVIQLKEMVSAKFWIEHKKYDLFQLLKLIDRDYC